MKGGLGTGANIISNGTDIGQRYDFRGRPNNGNISITVQTDDFTLVGNPYPSALDLKQFLIDTNYDRFAAPGEESANSQIDNSILFWEQYATSHFLVDYEGGYGTYVPGGVSNATLDANGQYTGVDNGMYVRPTYTRFDTSGNITTGTITGGPATPTGPLTSRRFAAIGQGFMISRSETSDDPSTPSITEPTFSAGTSGSTMFTNSQRTFFKEDGNLSIFKSAPGSTDTNPVVINPVYVRPKIRLNITIDDLYVRQLILAFGEDSTDNLDWGLEGKIKNNKQPTDVYMTQFNDEYTIKTIPFLETKTVELGVEAAVDNSTFKFHVGSFENFDTPFVFIHDKYNNTYHDVKNNDFTIRMNAGTVNDRFEIVFQEPTTLSNDTVSAEGQFDIIQNNDRQAFTVFNPNGLEVSSISLFDLSGKELISSKENTSNNSYTFETADFSTGIYIVRVITTDQRESAVKVSINN